MKPKKTNKPKKPKYKISVERILQISNDISEDMCEATAEELIEVATYWHDKLSVAQLKYMELASEMAMKLLQLGTKMLAKRLKI